MGLDTHWIVSDFAVLDLIWNCALLWIVPDCEVSN